EQQYIIKLKKLLANLGFYEIKTYKLVNEKLFNLFYHDQGNVGYALGGYPLVQKIRSRNTSLFAQGTNQA
ncbi:MAG: hypothetical protein Q8839_02670, partial [Candidatus Phytoplasma australasiaticum]|nr:hypothetical protein [Candidatus Phytoplasma australasiaticum]